MPGIFGYIEFSRTDCLKKVETETKARLMHLNSYVYRSVIHDNYLAGCITPNETDSGPYLDRVNGLLINFDGRLDYYLNKAGRKTNIEKGTEYEVLIDLYLQYSKQMTDYLSGIYNIVVYNFKSEEVLMFNDVFGNQISYYYDDGNTFIYGSELKVFLSYPGFTANLNQQSIADLFNFYRVWGEKSLLDGVKMLPAGGVVVKNKSGTSVGNYFVQKQSNEYADKDNEDIVAEGWALMNQSVDRSLAGKKVVSVPISGGIDSRFILALAQKREIKIKAFTHADSHRCIEYEIARVVIDKLNISDHRFLLIRPDDAGANLLWSSWLNDGMELASASYHVQLAAQMSEGSDGLLNGIFGGHMSFSDGFYFPEFDHNEYGFEKRFKLFTDMVKARGRSITSPSPDSGLFSSQFSSYLHESARETITKGFSTFENTSDNFSEQIIYYIRSVLLRNMMNRKDINRYFQKDELVFADPDLFRFFLKTPSHKKRDNKIYYKMIQRYLPELVAMPTIHTGERRVRKVLNRKGSERESITTRVVNKSLYYAGRLSRGRINHYDRFSYKHYNQWYRVSKSLRLQIEKILLDDRTLSRKHLNPDEVKSCVYTQRNGGDSYERLMMLAQVELFNRYFIEKDTPPAKPDLFQ